MRSRRVSFPGSQGEPLQGRLHLPVGPVEGTALFAHCFTCSKDLHAARRIAEALAERGFATLRFDFTGLGESSGDFADTTFGSNVEDLIAAAAWMETEVGSPTLLVGHSLGGAAVYVAAASIPSCRAVASVGAPSDPTHVEHLLIDAKQEIADQGEAVVTLAGRPFRVKQAFLDDLSTHHLTDRLKDLKRAVLVLHSPQDNTVGIENARALFQAAWHPKSFVSLDGADHMLSPGEDARYTGEVIASWARRYAATPVEAALHDDDVETSTEDSLRTTIVAHGKHRLVADEPPSVGGTDTGPTPFEYVSAGLGACTGMTLRMYAQRKKWPLLSTTVHLRHSSERIDGERVDRIAREVQLEGPELTVDQRERLLEIADRCPVHRALHRGFDVQTTLFTEADGGASDALRPG